MDGWIDGWISAHQDMSSRTSTTLAPYATASWPAWSPSRLAAATWRAEVPLPPAWLEVGVVHLVGESPWKPRSTYFHAFHTLVDHRVLAPLQNTLANVAYMWICPPQLKGWRSVSPVDQPGGFVYQAASMLLQKLRIDDPVDACPVHGFCGAWGLIAAGLFDWGRGIDHYHGWSGFGCMEKDDGGCQTGIGGTAIGVQIIMVLSIVAWAGTLSGIGFFLLKITGALRYGTHVEEVGIDSHHHSPPKAYALGPNSLSPSKIYSTMTSESEPSTVWAAHYCWESTGSCFLQHISRLFDWGKWSFSCTECLQCVKSHCKKALSSFILWQQERIRASCLAIYGLDFLWRSLHRVLSLRSKQVLWPCRKHAAHLNIFHEKHGNIATFRIQGFHRSQALPNHPTCQP